MNLLSTRRAWLMRWAFVFALCACAPQAFAATAATDAQIDELLEVARARQTIEAMLPQVEASQRQMIEQMLAGTSLDDRQRAIVGRIATRTGELTRKALAWDNMAPLYRDIYRQTFSGDDMQALIAFYRSPAGQKLLDKMPQLMQNTMAQMQKLLVPLMQDLQSDIARELEAASGAKAPPAGT